MRGGTQAVVQVHVVLQSHAGINDLLSNLVVLLLLEVTAQADRVDTVELGVESQSDVGVGSINDAAVHVEGSGAEAGSGTGVQDACVF